MAKALGGSAIEAFWSGTSFLLTSTVFQPVLGSFSHIFGRKTLIYVSLIFFLAGSIIAALADNFTVILVGRSIQGVGGGGIICLTEMVVVDTVPLRERGKWFSFFGAMWSLGTVAGPLLGKSSKRGADLAADHHRRRLCTERFVALDLLDQPTLSRDWNHPGHPLPQTQCEARLLHQQIEGDRLRRYDAISCLHDRFPRPRDLGRCSVPVG